MMRSLAILLLVLSKTDSFTQCFATPQQAMEGAMSHAVGPQSLGYRAKDVVMDATTRSAWVRIETCGHPELPLRISPLPLQLSGGAQRALQGVSTSQAQAVANKNAMSQVVRRGDVLQIHWEQEGVRLDMAAVAQEDGAIGDTITARLEDPWTHTGNQHLHRVVIQGAGKAVFP